MAVAPERITLALPLALLSAYHWKVEPPSGYVAQFAANNFTGVVKFPDHIVLLLDMEKIIWDLNPALAMREEPEAEAKVVSTPEYGYRALVVDTVAVRAARRVYDPIRATRCSRITRASAGKSRRVDSGTSTSVPPVPSVAKIS